MKEKWSPKEVEKLKILADDKNYDKEIAQELDRTIHSVRNKRYRLGIELNKLNENIFDKWSNKNSWALGLITADGSFNKSRPKEVTIYNSEKEMIEFYRDIFGSEKKIYEHKTKKVW